MEPIPNRSSNVALPWGPQAGAVHAPGRSQASGGRALAGAYGGLLLFMFIYFARPEDWIPGLANAPLAKIAGILAVVALALSLDQFRQRVSREVILLFLLAGQLLAASLLSPVWRGGAVLTTLDFFKLLLIVPLISGVVTSSRRLRWLLFTQGVSVAVIAVVMIWKGHSLSGRLQGILGGSYTDPNDLALAIILSLPLCLALLFLSRNGIGKIFWAISMLVMTYAVFLTGSRGGFLALLVVTAVCLWQFGVKGRRPQLLLIVLLTAAILWPVAGGKLLTRLRGTFDGKQEDAVAYDSAQSRQQLFWRSIEITGRHPFFGVGPGNFVQVSGQWHTTHNSLTLMSSEGGIPALILYVMILWCGFKNVRASLRLARGNREMTIQAQALAASLAGYAVGSLFLSWAYLYLPYILVAYTTALRSITRSFAAYSRKTDPDHQASGGKKLQEDQAAAQLVFPGLTDPAVNVP